MKNQKEDLPIKMQAPGIILRNLPGYGGMTVAYNEIPAGTDLTPLLEGLKNNSCHCPHWGYLLQGSMRVIYDDGKEEMVKTGDVFYLPSGHTVIVEEDVKLIDFNPEKEFQEVMDHIAKKMAE
ncbi:hypothetical protein BH23BAC1_BH23BAC1_28100 [soil metagenome]